MTSTFTFEKGKSSGELIHLHEFNDLACNLSSYGRSRFQNEVHHHNTTHLSYVVSGTYMETREGEIHHRKSGDVIFHPAFIPHKFKNSEERSTQNGFKNFNIEIDNRFFKRMDISHDSIESKIANQNLFRSEFIKFIFELGQNKSITESHLSDLLLDLLIEKAAEQHSNDLPVWVCRLKEIIHDRWNEPLSLQELSMEIGVHPVTISKNFQSYFGLSFSNYLKRLRVDKSISLLNHSGMSLTEISYHCGFSDQSHFIRSFKSLHGFTPKKLKDF
jgi:AraC family transcriptional regulator